MSADTIRTLTPELIVVLTAAFIYLAGAFLPNKRFWSGLGLVGLVVAGAELVGQYHHLFWTDGAQQPSLTAPVAGPLAVDLLGIFVRLLALVVGGVFVLLSSRPENEELTPEVIGNLMMAIAGVMLVGGTRELALLFLGLELISIPTYVLLFLGRRDGASAESTAKYFFLSILSSGVTLYGFSFLYGVGGSTRLDEIQAALAASAKLENPAPLFAQLALVLIVAGLGFKIAAVPFHFYAPDVYQGTTHGNAAVLAVLPKIAGIVALVRIVCTAMPGTEDTAIRVLMILALVTMTLGNIVALWQDDIRRTMAYSSIAQAGYMLVGLAVDFAARKGNVTDVDGVGATLFYTAAYSFASAGAFAAFTCLGGAKRSLDRIDDLAGTGRARPFAAVCAAIFLFSLAGLPPLPGFWGKFEIFSGAVKLGLADDKLPGLSKWFMLTAVVGMLNAAISAAYYLRMIGAMYFRPSDSAAEPASPLGPRMAMTACAMVALWISFGPGPLSTASNGAARSSRAAPSSPPAVATAPAVQPSAEHAVR